MPPDLSTCRFHPIVHLPDDYVVLDLRGPPQPSPTPWAVGRYDEVRGIYTQELFAGARTLHVGIDLGGPVGTAVHAFAAGKVLHAGYNSADGDYGYVIVTEHLIDDVPLYALFGHLSAGSLVQSPVDTVFHAGDVLGWLGDRHDNGGWPPHVHFQLCWRRPDTHDLPGAVDPAERDDALRLYPDPRSVLGPIY